MIFFMFKFNHKCLILLMLYPHEFPSLAIFVTSVHGPVDKVLLMSSSDISHPNGLGSNLAENKKIVNKQI